MADFCEIPSCNATSDEIRDILRDAHTIAVVGLSDKPDRDSYRVAVYLQKQGYRIIPVNPSVSSVLGEKCYPSLRDVPDTKARAAGLAVVMDRCTLKEHLRLGHAN